MKHWERGVQSGRALCGASGKATEYAKERDLADCPECRDQLAMIRIRRTMGSMPYGRLLRGNRISTQERVHIPDNITLDDIGDYLEDFLMVLRRASEEHAKLDAELRNLCNDIAGAGRLLGRLLDEVTRKGG